MSKIDHSLFSADKHALEKSMRFALNAVLNWLCATQSQAHF